MPVKRIGFFPELGGTLQKRTLRQLVDEQRAPLQDESQIVGYLRSCPLLTASPGLVGDVLDPSTQDVATTSIHADGMWIWPDELAYYVERYHIALPDEFVRHVRGARHQSPELSDSDLSTLAEEFIADTGLPIADGTGE